jgi:hypothetical protein
LIPAYAGLAAELQRAALLWLRDEVDLRGLSPELAMLLRRTPLVRAHDGELHVAAALYFAGEQAAGKRRAATPDMEFYRGDAARWRTLFAWLGLGEDPPPRAAAARARRPAGPAG